MLEPFIFEKCDVCFDFYKAFFDGINSFTRDFDDWTRWTKRNVA